MEKTKLQWHSGFSAALKMTLESEKECLEIHEEFQLSKKPLQIDILIVKKLKETTIKKSIAKLFRDNNIIEYKAPDDYRKNRIEFKHFKCLRTESIKLPVLFIFTGNRCFYDQIAPLSTGQNYIIKFEPFSFPILFYIKL